MNEVNFNDHSVRTIQLTDEQITKILDDMDAVADPRWMEKRKSPRFGYRIKALVVQMQQPGSSVTTSYLVPSRNLSADGVAFLHGGFVHDGTRCLSQLITTFGTWEDVWGTAIACRYVQANVHEVAVCFDNAIDPSIYCPAAVHSQVLFVEDSPAMTRLIEFHLHKLNAKVDHVDSGKEATEKAMCHPYDLILLDMDTMMPSMDGFDTIKELRSCGYTDTIVAATALRDSGFKESCLNAGCDKVMSKPFSDEDLSHLLNSLREEPLISSFYKDPSMVDIIDAYVQELPGQVRAIQEAFVKQDIEIFTPLIRTLKSEGSGYGFNAITETAERIETALSKGVAMKEVNQDITSLLKLCMHARSSAPKKILERSSVDSGKPPEDHPHPGSTRPDEDGWA